MYAITGENPAPKPEIIGGFAAHDVGANVKAWLKWGNITDIDYSRFNDYQQIPLDGGIVGKIVEEIGTMIIAKNPCVVLYFTDKTYTYFVRE